MTTASSSATVLLPLLLLASFTALVHAGSCSGSSGSCPYTTIGCSTVKGCYVTFGKYCHGFPDPCSMMYDEEDCEGHGYCEWSNEDGGSNNNPAPAPLEEPLCERIHVVNACQGTRVSGIVGHYEVVDNPVCGSGIDTSFPVYRSVDAIQVAEYTNGSNVSNATQSGPLYNWLFVEEGDGSGGMEEWTLLHRSAECEEGDEEGEFYAAAQPHLKAETDMECWDGLENGDVSRSLQIQCVQTRSNGGGGGNSGAAASTSLTAGQLSVLLGSAVLALVWGI